MRSNHQMMAKKIHISIGIVLFYNFLPGFAENPMLQTDPRYMFPDGTFCGTQKPDVEYSNFRLLVDQGRCRRYFLYRISDQTNKTPVVDLSVDRDGRAEIKVVKFLHSEHDNSLSEKLAKIRFGRAKWFGNLGIFELLGDYAGESNVFHLEIWFHNGIAQKYRVRGHGIVSNEIANIGTL